MTHGANQQLLAGWLTRSGANWIVKPSTTHGIGRTLGGVGMGSLPGTGVRWLGVGGGLAQWENKGGHV